MMTSESAGDEDEQPQEFENFADGVFDNLTPAFVQKRLREVPYEGLACKLVSELYRLGCMANVLRQRTEEYDALHSGELPESVEMKLALSQSKIEAARDELKKEKKELLGLQLSQQERVELEELRKFKAEAVPLQEQVQELTSLRSKKEALEKEYAEEKERFRREASKLREEKSRAVTERKKAEDRYAQLKRTVIVLTGERDKALELAEDADKRASRIVNDFLKSRSFLVAAEVATAPIVKAKLYELLECVAEHYPCEPEEFGVFPETSSSAVNLSSYSWDRYADTLQDANGNKLAKPHIYPDLSNVKLKEPWPEATKGGMPEEDVDEEEET